MQTFLPFQSFDESAACLDNKRLQKQIVECKQIYLALTLPEYGWKNHPAVLMWKGYEHALMSYAICISCNWERRFNKEHNLTRWFITFPVQGGFVEPPWLGDSRFHVSHQSNLYRKDPDYYHQFAGVGPDIAYFWPTKEGY